MTRASPKQKIAILTVILILGSAITIWLTDESHGEPSRAYPRDMAVQDITSHKNGSLVTMSPQGINATFENAGEDPYNDLILVNLSIYQDDGGNPGEMVHTHEVDRGSLNLAPGETFYQLFLPWTPSDPGFYFVNVTVDVSDDFAGNNSMVIQLEVISGGPVGVEVRVDDKFKALPQGTSTQDPGYQAYRFGIENTGLKNDSYQIDIRSNWVMGDPVNNTGILKPGEEKIILIDVEVPEHASYTEFDVLMFNVSSETDPTIWSQVNVTTYVQSTSGVHIDVFPKSQTAYPGGPWVDFTFFIRNTGNRNERYFLSYITSPSNWEVDYSVSVTPPLKSNRSISVTASVRIPELNYDTMENDNTQRGDFGGLVLQAEGEYFATGSAEGKVIVGLVHTVDIKMETDNKTVPWHPREEGFKEVNFTYRVRSVNNDYSEAARDMRVEFELPLGPSGVEFKPDWSENANYTESVRWMAGTANNISLKGGEWSPIMNLVVSYPSFPIHGVGAVLLLAEPQIPDIGRGFNVTSSRYAFVIVEPMLNMALEAPDPPEFTGGPGTKMNINFTVTNAGNTRDRYVSEASARPGPNSTTLPNDWDLEYPNGSRTNPLLPYWYDPIMGYHTENITILVTIPPAVPIGETVNITLRVQSMKSEDLERRAEVRITILQGFGLDLEPEETFKSGSPDEKIPFRLNVTNTGNGFDVVTFSNTVPSLENWEIEFETSDLDMEPGDKRTVTVWVTPSSESLVDQTLSIKVKAISYMASLRGLNVYDEVYINTTVDYRGSISLNVLGNPEIWRYPGETATFEFEIRNTGNGNDSFLLDLTKGATEWSMDIDVGNGGSGESVSVFIPIGEKTKILVNVTLPAISEASTMEELQQLQIMAFTEVVNYLEIRPSNDPEGGVNAEFTVGVLQEFKTDIYLMSGEESNKEVLPGREVTYNLDLENAGNGYDNISAEMEGSLRHIRWAFLDGGPYRLAPFETSPLNLSVIPIPEDLPNYHETVSITIEAIASDGNAYKRTTIQSTVVMSEILSDTMELDLGQMGQIEMLLCNMPDPGETPTPNFVMQKSYSITPELYYEGDRSKGWRVSNSSTEIILTEPYETVTVDIPVNAPSDFEVGSENARVNLRISGGEGKTEYRNANLRAVFFDIMISKVTSDLYEGGDGELNIFLVASGTRSQDEIPIVVYVGDDMYGPFTLGPTNPEDFSSRETYLGGTRYVYGEQESFQQVKIGIPSLRWYEKGMDIELRVIVDPDNQIIENTVEGSELAESNNLYREDIEIKNYTPSLPVILLLGILFLIIAIGGVIGYFFLERKDSWFMIPLAAGFTGVFGLLFYIPVEESGRVGIANTIGIILIVINLAIVIPFFIYLFTRSSDAYILHLLTTRRDKDPPQGTESTKSPLKAYLISIAGGLLASLIPVSLWTFPSYIRESGLAGIADAIIDMEAGFPVWAFVLLFPLLAVIAQSIMLMLKRGSLNRVTGTWDHLERLRNEIEEGFQ